VSRSGVVPGTSRPGHIVPDVLDNVEAGWHLPGEEQQVNAVERDVQRARHLAPLQGMAQVLVMQGTSDAAAAHKATMPAPA
jgi:hypothetical protein